MSAEQQLHKKLAVDLFNQTWELLDKSGRTQAENDTMLHAAHASRYHWEQIGAAVNLARGEWQVSRVYSVLERAEPALYHARRSLEICQNNDIVDFDLAFAYEALARAFAIAGNVDQSRHFLASAIEAGDAITDEGDREVFFSEVNSVPRFNPES